MSRLPYPSLSPPVLLGGYVPEPANYNLSSTSWDFPSLPSHLGISKTTSPRRWHHFVWRSLSLSPDNLLSLAAGGPFLSVTTHSGDTVLLFYASKAEILTFLYGRDYKLFIALTVSRLKQICPLISLHLACWLLSSVADMRAHKPTRGKTHRHQTGQLQKIIPKSVFHSYILLYTRFRVTGVHSGGKTCDTTWRHLAT